MSSAPPSSEAARAPAHYEIRIQGHMDDRWAGWFEGMTITREDSGETLLAGAVVDQAALHGLLRKVRDLGLPLISVIQVEPRQTNAPRISADVHSNQSTEETNT